LALQCLLVILRCSLLILVGTNSDIGSQILRDSGLPIITAENLDEAAQKACATLREWSGDQIIIFRRRMSPIPMICILKFDKVLLSSLFQYFVRFVYLFFLSIFFISCSNESSLLSCWQSMHTIDKHAWNILI
jgi:hypothetical protein